MIIDKLLEFGDLTCDAAETTTSDVLDLGAATGFAGSSIVAEDYNDIYCIANVVAKTIATAEVVTVILETSSDEAFGTAANVITTTLSPAQDESFYVVGTPAFNGTIPRKLKRYVRVKVTLSGTYTSGLITINVALNKAPLC